MRRVLIVAYYFPPIAASGSMRPLGFSRYLVDFGWTPSILTTSPESLIPPQRGDADLLKMVPDGMEVDVVPHGNPLQALIRMRDRLRERIHGLLPRVRTRHESSGGHTPRGNGGGRSHLSSMKDLVLDWTFEFPDRQCGWFGPSLRRMADLPRDRRPDVVLATGGPWTGLLVGRALAKRFRVPFVADFRDPWTMNPLGDQMSVPWLTRRAMGLEGEVCAQASRIIVNTDELRTQFCLQHPQLKGKCVTITNGFDEDAVQSALASGVAGEPMWSAPGEAGLELCHFGTVYGSRSPRRLLRAVSELLEEGSIRRRDVSLRFVGVWEDTDTACEELARALENQGVLRREPALPREQCLTQMARSRCLLALQGDYPLQTPGKLYEYIAMRRPLLVIGGEGATAQLMERVGMKCCPNNVADIKDVLRGMVTGQERVELPLRREAERFHYRALTGRLAEVLSAVCGEGYVNCRGTGAATR